LLANFGIKIVLNLKTKDAVRMLALPIISPLFEKAVILNSSLLREFFCLFPEHLLLYEE